MDEPILIFLGAFAGLTVGFPLLAAYCYVLYRFGQRIAEKFFGKYSRNFLIVASCLAWIPVCAVGLLIPGSEFGKLAYWVILYLFHAYPCLVGLVYKHQYLGVQEVKRRRKNVDDWLSEWECVGNAEEPHDWDSIFNSGPDEPPHP